MTEDEARALWEEARDADLIGPDAAGWTERLGGRRGELREAVAVLDPERAAELANATFRLWFAGGDLDGAAALLAPTLEGPPTPARARALYHAGMVAFRQGDQAASLGYSERALEAARAAGDAEAESLALVGLARVALREGDYARVVSLSRDARRLGAESGPAGEAMPLHLEAAGTRLLGHLPTARALYEESLALNRGLGSVPMQALELHNLLHVELHLGDRTAAQRRFDELEPLRSSGAYHDAMRALNLAALADADGDGIAAREHLEQCLRTLEEAAIALDPDDRLEVDFLLDRL